MNDQIKNRVVGAIVLFSLAIIFLPKIFDGEKISQRRDFVAIPQKPLHQAPDLAKVNTLVPVSAIAEVVEQENATVTQGDSSKVNTATKTDPVAIKAEAWVIRMGIFGDPSNVHSLIKKLRQAGFTAFSIPIEAKKGLANAVYVGPELNKNTLTKLQPRLKKLFSESGVIVKYDPLTK